MSRGMNQCSTKPVLRTASLISNPLRKILRRFLITGMWNALARSAKVCSACSALNIVSIRRVSIPSERPRNSFSAGGLFVIAIDHTLHVPTVSRFQVLQSGLSVRRACQFPEPVQKPQGQRAERRLSRWKEMIDRSRGNIRCLGDLGDTKIIGHCLAQQLVARIEHRPGDHAGYPRISRRCWPFRC